MILFDDFTHALEEVEYCAKQDKHVYGIRMVSDQYEVYRIYRRGTHNPLEMSGRRSGRPNKNNQEW